MIGQLAETVVRRIGIKLASRMEAERVASGRAVSGIVGQNKTPPALTVMRDVIRMRCAGARNGRRQGRISHKPDLCPIEIQEPTAGALRLRALHHNSSGCGFGGCRCGTRCDLCKNLQEVRVIVLCDMIAIPQPGKAYWRAVTHVAQPSLRRALLARQKGDRIAFDKAAQRGPAWRIRHVQPCDCHLPQDIADPRFEIGLDCALVRRATLAVSPTGNIGSGFS